MTVLLILLTLSLSSNFYQYLRVGDGETFYRSLWMRAEKSVETLLYVSNKQYKHLQEYSKWYRVAYDRLHSPRQRKLEKAYRAQCKREYANTSRFPKKGSRQMLAMKLFHISIPFWRSRKTPARAMLYDLFKEIHDQEVTQQLP